VLIPIYADTTYDEIDEAIRNLETRNRRKTRKTKEAKQ
jgi:hypothetical protein